MPRITTMSELTIGEMLVASMRPGRNAPDNSYAGRLRERLKGFNEAGAKCPG